jgi:predicted nucleic acid-binding protein
LSYDGIFRLADRHGLTVYDAAYLDLGLRKSLPLASLDDALVRAAERLNRNACSSIHFSKWKG